MNNIFAPHGAVHAGVPFVVTDGTYPGGYPNYNYAWGNHYAYPPYRYGPDGGQGLNVNLNGPILTPLFAYGAAPPPVPAERQYVIHDNHPHQQPPRPRILVNPDVFGRDFPDRRRNDGGPIHIFVDQRVPNRVVRGF